MPLRRHKNKKRAYKVKRRPRRRRNAMVRYVGKGLTRSAPLPKSFKFRTKYVENLLDINPGISGAAAGHLFSLNGLYDPNITGVGHQALGFDQMVGVMYDHYTVVGARARVTFSNLDTTYAQMCLLSIQDDTTATPADLGNLIENGMCRWNTVAPSGAGGSTKTLQINFSPNKFFGKRVMQDDIFRGAAGSNPNEQAYLHIAIQPVAAVDTSAVRCTVEIEYIAVLTEPKILASS